MIKGSISKWLTGVAACGLAVGAVAAPFSVKYSDTVFNSSVAAIPNGQQVTVEFILDNGGSSTASQSWSAANLKLVCFTFNNDPTKFASINYSGSPLTAGPETFVLGSFTTNGSGQLQSGALDWEDFRSPFTAPNLTNIAGVTAVTDWFIDAFNHVVSFGAAGQLGFTNVTNDGQFTNWSNPVASTGSCSGGSSGPGPTTNTPIPTLSEWALVLLIGLMLAVGAAAVRGRYRR